MDGIVFVIHKNARVNVALYLGQRDGPRVEIDPGALFKCSIKKSAGQPVLVTSVSEGGQGVGAPVLTFVSGGGPGVGNIEIIKETVDGKLTDLLLFTTPDEILVANLTPGPYVGDVLRTDDKDWTFGFRCQVDEGITAP